MESRRQPDSPLHVSDITAVELSHLQHHNSSEGQASEAETDNTSSHHHDSSLEEAAVNCSEWTALTQDDDSRYQIVDPTQRESGEDARQTNTMPEDSVGFSYLPTHRRSKNIVFALGAAISTLIPVAFIGRDLNGLAPARNIVN